MFLKSKTDFAYPSQGSFTWYIYLLHKFDHISSEIDLSIKNSINIK